MHNLHRAVKSILDLPSGTIPEQSKKQLIWELNRLRKGKRPSDNIETIIDEILPGQSILVELKNTWLSQDADLTEFIETLLVPSLELYARSGGDENLWSDSLWKAGFQEQSTLQELFTHAAQIIDHDLNTVTNATNDNGNDNDNGHETIITPSEAKLDVILNNPESAENKMLIPEPIIEPLTLWNDVTNKDPDESDTDADVDADFNKNLFESGYPIDQSDSDSIFAMSDTDNAEHSFIQPHFEAAIDDDGDGDDTNIDIEDGLFSMTSETDSKTGIVEVGSEYARQRERSQELDRELDLFINEVFEENPELGAAFRQLGGIVRYSPQREKLQQELAVAADKVSSHHDLYRHMIKAFTDHGGREDDSNYRDLLQSYLDAAPTGEIKRQIISEIKTNYKVGSTRGQMVRLLESNMNLDQRTLASKLAGPVIGKLVRTVLWGLAAVFFLFVFVISIFISLTGWSLDALPW